MSKFIKTAIAAAMVMGAVSSASFAEGLNNGTARFYGTIEDSPCSIKTDDHKLEVDLGDIGTGSLNGGLETTPKDFQIHLIDCHFNKGETKASTTFFGAAYSGNNENYALFNTLTGREVPNVSMMISNEHGDHSIHRGQAISQDLVKDSSVQGQDIMLTSQTLNFKAWLVGESTEVAPTPAPFEANTTFQITYL